MMKQDNFEQFLEKVLDNCEDSLVKEAMNYSLLAGGKRIRPRLLFSVANSYGANYHDMMLCGCAIEMIHTYSLVHDDLPAMDNDTLRRGKNTCHIQFDEATAILAGDGLLTYAFELLSNVESKNALMLVKELAKYSGMNGMILGQTLDVESDHSNYQELVKSHTLKTGCLFACSLRMGAIISDSLNYLDLLEDIGFQLGVAFQIQDDILDYQGSIESGKSSSDIANNRNTATSVLGLEGAITEYNRVYQELRSKLTSLPRSFPALDEIIDQLLTREK